MSTAPPFVSLPFEHEVYPLLHRVRRFPGHRSCLRCLHLIVEADSNEALTRGMQGLGVRIAKGLNRVMRRNGRVFADHYHSRILATPTELVNAISHVLGNAAHHYGVVGIDPFSSLAYDAGRRCEILSHPLMASSLGMAPRENCSAVAHSGTGSTSRAAARIGTLLFAKMLNDPGWDLEHEPAIGAQTPDLLVRTNAAEYFVEVRRPSNSWRPRARRTRYSLPPGSSATL